MVTFKQYVSAKRREYLFGLIPMVLVFVVGFFVTEQHPAFFIIAPLVVMLQVGLILLDQYGRWRVYYKSGLLKEIAPK